MNDPNRQGAAKTFRDLTDRKPIEEQLRDLNAALDDRVREQTQELRRREDRLRALAAQLTHAEQQERRRVATILHEHVQQLLVAAQMFAERAQGKTAEPEVQSLLEQALDTIREATQACRSLSVDLSPPVLHAQGLVPAAHWLAERMQKRYRLAVEVTADPAAEPHDVELRELLFLALSELLLNVVKHARTDRASVRIGRWEDGRVQIEVCDRGQGFDPQTCDEAAVSGKSWGLFQIRERLEWIGGTLAVASAPGAGTCVTVVAPREDAAPARREPAWPEEEKDPAQRKEKDPDAIQVVLIDDHEAVRTALSILIDQQRDLQVIGEAGEGKIGLDIVRDLEPDVVVMDINLPGLSGVEATRQIAQERPQVRVIGLSMYDSQDVAQEMLAAGAAAHLPKSAPAADLIAKIRDVHRRG